MKKTNKVHPITAFRKANEARQAVVKKSMKKAQDGIETGNDMMVNKPGSTGGYKKPSNPLAPYAGNMATLAEQMSKSASSSRNNVDIANAVKLPSRNNQLKNYGISPYNQSREVLHKAYMDAVTNKPESYTQMMSTVRKRGGAVKTKKRK